MTLNLLLRWLAGILLSAMLTLGAAILFFHHVINVDMNNLTPLEFWISNIFLAGAFGLFVFCACWFAPAWKRNAGIFALAFCVLFISAGIYNHITYDGFLHQDHIIRYSSFLLAIVFAFFMSRKKFGQNKWLGA
jgi:tryptophan-rich sensory protein